MKGPNGARDPVAVSAWKANDLKCEVGIPVRCIAHGSNKKG